MAIRTLAALRSPRAIAYRRRYRARLWVLTRAEPLTTRLVRLRRRTLARNQRIIAITGTQGKTTTTRCIRAILALPESAAVEASPNMERSLSPLLLAHSPFRKCVAIEMGIGGPGEMKGLMRLVQPNVVVMTSIGTEHHRRFSSLAALRQEKELAVRLLPPDGVAILNADDPAVAAMAEAAMAAVSPARVVTFGTAATADIRASNITLEWPRGATFVLHIPGRAAVAVRTRLLGPAGVSAALAAIAVGYVEGVPLEPSLARLARLRSTHRRNEVFPLANGATALVDDSKAPPEGVEVFIDLVRQVPAPGRRILLLGKLDPTPGDEGEFYARFADAVAALADLVVIAGKPEPAELYRLAFARAGFDDGRLMFVSDASAATRYLRPILQPTDTLFIKGTGNLRLTRTAIALSGTRVTCAKKTCPYSFQYCQTCPLLALPKPWPTRR